MKSNTWEDHTEVNLPGWIQVGSILGTKYGTWVRVINGNRHSITSSKDSDGYWLKINNCYFGRYDSPKSAKKVSDEYEENQAPLDPSEAETER